MKLSILAVGVLFLVQPVSAEEGIWTICHATGDPSAPYITTHSRHWAYGNHFYTNEGVPRQGHGGDVLIQGETTCPAPEPEVPVAPKPVEPPQSIENPESPVGEPQTAETTVAPERPQETTAEVKPDIEVDNTAEQLQPASVNLQGSIVE